MPDKQDRKIKQCILLSLLHILLKKRLNNGLYKKTNIRAMRKIIFQ